MWPIRPDFSPLSAAWSNQEYLLHFISLALTFWNYNISIKRKEKDRYTAICGGEKKNEIKNKGDNGI